MYNAITLLKKKATRHTQELSTFYGKVERKYIKGHKFPKGSVRAFGCQCYFAFKSYPHYVIIHILMLWEL